MRDRTKYNVENCEQALVQGCGDVTGACLVGMSKKI
jgi:hypothetical protein